MRQINTKALKRLFDAAIFSITGIQAAWKNEAAFRQEIAVCVVLIPLAFWLGANATQKALLIGCCFIVLITELLNTALEAAVDRVSLDKNDLSALAKDLGSAAVFISLFMTATVWGLIAYERFFH